MTTCDYCGQPFSSGGVTVNGLGTFCNYKCRVLKAHQPLYTQLHTYQCPRCRPIRIMTTPGRQSWPTPYKCNVCFSWMKYGWSETITTEAQQVLAARGNVFNPYSSTGPTGWNPPPWTCARCGNEKRGTAHRIHRPDGDCCRDCYKAEEHPPLATPAEIAAKAAERAAVRRDDEDRMEAAYAAQEKQR